MPTKIAVLAASILCLMPLAISYAQSDEAIALIEQVGLRESNVASREMEGWSRPSRITVTFSGEVPAEGPGSESWFRAATDGVEVKLLKLSGRQVDSRQLIDSDVYVGRCSPDMIADGGRLRYVHIYSAGIDRCTSIPGITELKLIVTNGAKTSSETIAEHSIALLLALSRNIHLYHHAQMRAKWARGGLAGPPAISLRGKTLLVLGLGGIGTQVARRANDLGMRVIGTRNSSRSGPEFVEYVGLSNEMVELAAQANVVVNALPLTDATRLAVNAEFLDNMPDGSYYVSVGRGGTTDTGALVEALRNGKLAGAGLDVTDPEPLPADHVLWSMPTVLITPHVAGRSDLGAQNRLILARENLRRYVRGEKLLNLVDLERGY